MADQKEPTMAEIMEQLTIMQNTINQQNETIVQLKGEQAKTKLETKEPVKLEVPKDAVKHGDKEYKFQVAQFVLPPYGNVTAEEASLSPEIIKAIVDTPGQGILKEQA